MDNRRYVYIMSNEQPGWLKGKVYLGEIIDDFIVFNDGTKIKYQPEIKHIENGYDIRGYSGLLSQDMLRDMYSKQNRREAEAAHRLLDIKGGRTRKRNKRKRNSRLNLKK
jgi:hypothetical protein